jgi:hypothetical protein
MKKRATKPTKRRGIHVNAMFFEGIPPTVRKEFKAACVRKNTNMKKEFIKFMTVFAKAA